MNTLKLRLALSSALWIAVTLLVTGILVVWLFRGHIERRLENQLADHLEELVAAAEVDATGDFTLTWTPADPRFNRPQSGWYWQVQEGGRVVRESPSIFATDLPARPGTFRAAGPRGEGLVVHARAIRLPRAASAHVFVVAGPESDVAGDVEAFAGAIAAVLGVLALLLVGIVVLQVGFGLKPLGRIQGALAAIRSGREHRLPEDFPGEVQPVVSELNALLDHNAALLARARTQVGNLAHALKNPLAVLANEAAHLPAPEGDLMRHQVRAAADSVERHLRRARIAGAGNVLGATADLGRVVRDLVFSLGVLYRDRDLEIRAEGLDGIHVRVDAEDLEEMLGNLMDNACKWARRTVTVSASSAGGRVFVTVGDDGPGIPGDRRAEVLAAGTRLDERAPGSGLGLGIVDEIARLYGGGLALAESSAGGLKAELVLPGVEG